MGMVLSASRACPVDPRDVSSSSLQVDHSMDAMSPPSLQLRHRGARQGALSLTSEAVHRYAGQSPYGSFLIEVVGDEVFVNGQRVEPHAKEPCQFMSDRIHGAKPTASS